MRHETFAPFYRSSVGFDHLFNLLDQVTQSDENGYPPYNIERLEDDKYRITMAVAGFGQDEINVEVKEQLLTIKGEKVADDKERAFLYRGIASRTFERRFQLADHVEVVGADLKDGLLHLDLVRNLPERMKPRTITIGAGSPKQLEVSA